MDWLTFSLQHVGRPQVEECEALKVGAVGRIVLLGPGTLDQDSADGESFSSPLSPVAHLVAGDSWTFKYGRDWDVLVS